jgi:predicted alpha/beta superfamily hydrolase
MKTIFTLLLACYAMLLFSQMNPPMPSPGEGRIERFENFSSKYIQPRNIDIWFPANYDSTKRYSVVYMHDGQMLFDSAATWNKQEWQVDEKVSALLKAGKIKDCIVVGIWNNGEYRHAEYFPQKSLKYLPVSTRDSFVSLALKGKPLADNYLLFLTKELKPYIDSKFSTFPDRDHTFIMGSSMGGLISLYAVCEYPDVFGGAACLSTHWPGTFSQNKVIPDAINRYLEYQLPDPKKHKLYFDYGDATLDALYKPHQQMIDNTLKFKGFSKKNWMTKEFPSEDHSEKAWSKRLDVPFQFLLSEKRFGIF